MYKSKLNVKSGLLEADIRAPAAVDLPMGALGLGIHASHGPTAKWGLAIALAIYFCKRRRRNAANLKRILPGREYSRPFQAEVVVLDRRFRSDKNGKQLCQENVYFFELAWKKKYCMYRIETTTKWFTFEIWISDPLLIWVIARNKCGGERTETKRQMRDSFVASRRHFYKYSMNTQWIAL